MVSNNFSKSQRDTIWKKYFGNSDLGVDAFERKVYKDNFECDHVYPKSRGGKTTIENGIPLNPESNKEKVDNLSGKVNGKKFRIEENNGNGILYVEEIIKTKSFLLY